MTDLLNQPNKQATILSLIIHRSYLLGKTPEKQKAVITEGTEVTGNRETETNVSVLKQTIMFDIRRLAGLN